MIKRNLIKKTSITSILLAMCLMAVGCGKSNDKTSIEGEGSSITASSVPDTVKTSNAKNAEDSRKEITKEFSITSENSSSVKKENNTYTITQAGEYTISGLLKEGQIIVDAPEDAEVSLILSDTSITCSTDSAIYVKSADKVKIKSEENTFNEVIDARATKTTDSSSSDEAGSAAIYSTTDLSLVGKGALVVKANYNNGIQSKDDLSIKNVTLNVSAQDNALKGNDSVEIESGEIIASSSSGDGIKTSNSSLSSKGKQKGNVTITGGNIDLYVAGDGIDAACSVDISGDGNINIFTDKYKSGDVSALNDKNTSKVQTQGNNKQGNFRQQPGNTQSSNSTDTPSTKGIKSYNEINISGGNINIYSTDDAIHANSDGVSLESGAVSAGKLTISDGKINIATGDDGLHADQEININGGYINISNSYEGIEALTINMNDGKVYVYASDDGVNASGKSKTPSINVTGGYLDVTTPTGDTDAIDSNGNYIQSGGLVFVKGGASSGGMAGSIDVDGSVTVTGGTVFAVGGICETPSNSVNAYVFQQTSFSSGKYVLKDESGNELYTFELSENYSNGWICSGSLKTGSKYTMTKDGSDLASWTQEAGTMGAAAGMGGNGGMGGHNMGGQNMGGQNMGGGVKPGYGEMPENNGNPPVNPQDNGNQNYNKRDKQNQNGQMY